MFCPSVKVARVNKYNTTDVTRVLKALGAELCQNGCVVVNEQKIFCSHQCSPECSMNKFRAYIYPQTRVSSFPGLIIGAQVNE